MGTKNSLRRHLSAKKNDKVILTDTLKWEFYIKHESKRNLVPIRAFKLYDLTGGRAQNWE
jgi:hypothetical protein